MKFKITPIFLIVLLATPLSVFGAGSFTNPTNLLNLGFGARAIGMGGSFVGLSDGVDALFYNPAGLAYFEGWKFSSSYSAQFGLASYGTIGVTKDCFGGAILYFNSSGISERNEADELVGNFTYSNLAAIASYGIKISLERLPYLSNWFGTQAPSAEAEDLAQSDNFSENGQKLPQLLVGLRGKFLQKNLGTVGSASSWSLDPAILMKIRKLKIGGMLSDFIGQGFNWSTHSEQLKGKVTLGFSYPLYEYLILTGQWGTEDGIRGGAELTYEQFKLRAGVCQNPELSYAIGFGYEFGKNSRVDYAYQLHPKLPGSHLLSFTMEMKELKWESIFAK